MSVELTEESILREQARLGPDDSFCFSCGPHMDCFTRCCADVAIVLTPYDIVRLKGALGIDSSEFLERHTICRLVSERKFPMVLLKMEGDEKKCPFVAAEGCSVYRDRPWACRMYPLGAAEPRTPTPQERAFHFLVREDLCHGHGTGRTCTVRDWIAGQGAEEYDAYGASFKEIMLDEFWDKPEPLRPQQSNMFYMACYDLDRFRRFVFESTFLNSFEVDEARLEAMRRSDEELLDFAMQWLRFVLFRERTMKIKASVMEAKRQAQGGAK